MQSFTPAELRKLRSLKTPYGIQRFIDDMPYHLATSAWSPRRVLREREQQPDGHKGRVVGRGEGGEDHEERIAAEPRRHVAAPNECGESFGELPEDLILHLPA